MNRARPFGAVDALPGRIDWTCQACGEPTISGAIRIDLQQVREREREWAAWRRRHSEGNAFDFSEIISAPRCARWRVSCDTCHRGCTDTCYEIGLEQCRTIYALIKWTAHLYGKNWFSATDWIDFIHRVAQQHGPVEATGVH